MMLCDTCYRRNVGVTCRRTPVNGASSSDADTSDHEIKWLATGLLD